MYSFKLHQRLKRLKWRNAKLFAKNIILLADIETIADDPNSPEAKTIIRRVKQGIAQRREREQASQN